LVHEKLPHGHRKTKNWLRKSDTLDTGFCIEAIEEALAKYGKPEIFNTHQGSQFTRLEQIAFR
jgi:putative transposase